MTDLARIFGEHGGLIGLVVAGLMAFLFWSKSQEIGRQNRYDDNRAEDVRTLYTLLERNTQQVERLNAALSTLIILIKDKPCIAKKQDSG